MKPLPLNVQTLYADLLQGMSFSTTLPGSVYTQTIRGRPYLYAAEKHGAVRRTRYLGFAEDPDASERAEAVRRAAADAKTNRTTVAMLKRAGVSAPTLALGRVLEALANAGLFRKGMVLVGTAAYQTYPAAIGVALSPTALATQDADLAAVALAVSSDIAGESLLDVLKRADPTFAAQPGLDGRTPPRRFRSAAKFEVDVLTRYRKRADDERPVVLSALHCSALPLRYLEFLIEEPVPAVALYGSGVPVSVPRPSRYAVHKLIVAQVRSEASTKRAKDLAQAKELIEALRVADPYNLEDALTDARGRGGKWKTYIARSLREIGIDM